MKNIYLYGASDDCCEIETDFDGGFEAYGNIGINNIVAEYKYDSDWGIRLVGEIPSSWKVRCITGNSPFRYEENTGQFIHIQIPEGEIVTFKDLSKT